MPLFILLTSCDKNGESHKEILLNMCEVEMLERDTTTAIETTKIHLKRIGTISVMQKLQVIKSLIISS
jgi:hypothetical protein